MTKYFYGILYFLMLPLFHCCTHDNQPIPKWDERSLTLEKYNNFASLLKDAYAANDNYQIALQLANLNGDKRIFRTYLVTAVTENPENCLFIYKNKHLANQGFHKNIFKFDSISFKLAFEQCQNYSSGNGFAEYLSNQSSTEERFLANRPELDSTGFNSELISLLKIIHENDQKFRAEIGKLEQNSPERNELTTLQKKIDLENIRIVDSILLNSGYPTVDQVGYEFKWTIFLVLHHQIDREERAYIYEKYGNNFSPGQKAMFLDRSYELTPRSER